VIPTSAHNEALSGDTLYSAFLNYEWREIVLPFVISGMERIAASIEDETERQDFEVLYGAMIDDFYNEDVVDNTPVGITAWYPHWLNTMPEKWLRCEGQTLNVADYPDLANILHAPFFSGGSTFTLPDLRTKFLYGASINDDLGDEGGSNTHTLTTAELPAHHHIVPAHAHTVGTRPAAGSNTGSVSLGSLAANGTIATDTEPATDTSDTGGAGSHNNMPAYMRGYWIMKVLP